jgi:hypothetical protein
MQNFVKIHSVVLEIKHAGEKTDGQTQHKGKVQKSVNITG